MFGQHDMADALHVEEIRNAVLGGEGARGAQDGSALGIHRRNIMIGDDRDP